MKIFHKLQNAQNGKMLYSVSNNFPQKDKTRFEHYCLTRYFSIKENLVGSMSNNNVIYNKITLKIRNGKIILKFI